MLIASLWLQNLSPISGVAPLLSGRFQVDFRCRFPRCFQQCPLWLQNLSLISAVGLEVLSGLQVLSGAWSSADFRSCKVLLFRCLLFRSFQVLVEGACSSGAFSCAADFSCGTAGSAMSAAEMCSWLGFVCSWEDELQGRSWEDELSWQDELSWRVL